jgi:hypothetical protein
MNAREITAQRYWEICRAVVDRPFSVVSAAECLNFLRDHQDSEWTALGKACKATLEYNYGNVATTSFSEGISA